jgi:SAM-dependent methyltransferase
MRPPKESVRGAIRAFIERFAWLLGDDVLEVGSRAHDPGAWWIINRDLALGQWTGVDMQPGHNVDRVVDMHTPPEEWRGRFTGVLCSEVLEHVRRPTVFLEGVRSVMRPGGLLVVTTLFSFPEHGFPNDYRRWTRAGLEAELEDAGFTRIETFYDGVSTVHLNDHGEPGTTRRDLPRHVFAVARAPA